MRARALPVTADRSHSGRGRAAAAGDDLDLVAVVQLGAQLDHAAVDLGADAAVADLGMDGVGEVDRRGAARQGDQVALGREAEHLVGEHLELGVLEEVLGVGGMLEDVEKLADPAILLALGDPAFLLVAPVRRHPELGDLVHVAGADLDLDLAPLGTDDRGVQRAVAVGLGRADEVFEPPRQHMIGAVDHAQRGVAVGARRRHGRGTP